jgi:LysM repeat protein
MNGIRDANHIRVGQVLRVLGGSPATSPVASAPAPAAPTPTSGAAQPEESYYYYPVADGDTMQTVAKLFFTTPQDQLHRCDPDRATVGGTDPALF